MKQPTWESEIGRVVKEIGKFAPEAYFFVFEALDYTLKHLKREGHVSGKELLEGIRELAKDKFGYLAKPVLNFWGVYETEDFGEIVFALVRSGLMGKTEKDSVEDFLQVYDFEDAFIRDFKFRLEARGKPGK